MFAGSLSFLTWCVLFNAAQVALPPKRFSYSLNGLWNFDISPATSFDQANEELKDIELFFAKDWIDMPVPSSFNDVTTNSTIRDHVGWAWYWREITILPSFANEGRYFVKFGDVHYSCHVWYNERKVGHHEGGHIPFEIELTDAVKEYRNQTGRIIVGVNNTLSEYTLPQGRLITQNDTSRYPRGFKTYTHSFDYFDYSGINGNVDLLMKPAHYVKDVTIRTEFLQTGAVAIEVKVEANNDGSLCMLRIYDPRGKIFETCKTCTCTIATDDYTLWWPAHTIESKEAGRLYTLEVDLYVESYDSGIVDTYQTKFGIRQIRRTSSTLMLNGEPIYLKGFGMHQDAEIRGRGFDWVTLTRDMQLLDWTQANVIRTSHYPYSEEFLNMADERGLLVVMETPACSLSVFDEPMLEVHKSVIHEMWKTFKNHPSIIMWSLANEPLTSSNSSDEYFRSLSDFVRTFDTTRQITFVTSQQIENEKAVQHMDVICVNRYNAWYQDSGHLEVIPYRLTQEITQWADKFQKPVILTEYGAGALAGLHELPSTMWSEDYQIDLFAEHFTAFDNLRGKGHLAGELIWNFADFKTPQEYIRPGVCAKGIFTRNRQPKAVAKSVRDRYKQIRPTANDL